MRYRASWSRTGRFGDHEYSEIVGTFSEALQLALPKRAGHKVVTILKDQEGTDHPDNAGKFFLNHIVK